LNSNHPNEGQRLLLINLIVPGFISGPLLAGKDLLCHAAMLTGISYILEIFSRKISLRFGTVNNTRNSEKIFFEENPTPSALPATSIMESGLVSDAVAGFLYGKNNFLNFLKNNRFNYFARIMVAWIF
jgi:hypothetical protein